MPRGTERGLVTRSRWTATGGTTSVVFVSTEVAPWSKVGGLADVVSALPKALVGLDGIGEVMSVTPMYEAYENVEACGVEVRLPEAVVEGFDVEGYLEEVLKERDNCECDHDDPDDSVDLEDSEEYERREHPINDGDCGERGLRFASLYSTTQGGVRRVFVRHPLLDMHRVVRRQDVNNEHPSFTYVEGDGGVYDCRDMAVRYDIMAWGALMAAAKLGGTRRRVSNRSGGQVDQKNTVVFVLNDWPTALVLVRLRELMSKPVDALTDVEREIAGDLGNANIKTVFCIHNLAYQGVFSADAVARDLGLGAGAMAPLMPKVPWERVGSKSTVLESKVGVDVQLEIHGEDEVNFLRGALLLADSVLTVSPHYAAEIAAENEDFSCGMGDILRYKQVQGIMNGIDTDEWDPETDALLPEDSRYNAYTVFRGKNSMKRRLQARLGLVVDDSAVLFVFIGRLTEQKGVDALLRAATRLLPKKPAPGPVEIADVARDLTGLSLSCGSPTAAAKSPNAAMAATKKSRKSTKISPVALHPTPPIQLAVLGTGDQWLEQAVSSLEFSFPGTAKGVCEFSEELAHWMLAASDYCMIPSKFEPCGLIAQCAARYGAVPIMTATGGLKNLGDAGVGVLVPRRDSLQESVDDLVDAMKVAIDEHGSDSHCNQRAFGMKYDFSWNVHAREWQALLLQEPAEVRGG